MEAADDLDTAETPLVVNLRKKQAEIEEIQREALSDLVGAVERCEALFERLGGVGGGRAWLAWRDALALLGEESEAPVAGPLHDIASFVLAAPEANRGALRAARVALEVLS